MKIITSKLTLLIILSTIIVVGNLTISQTSMADNIDKSFTSSSSSSFSLHPISVQNLDTTADSNQYHDSFVWSHPSTSKMTDVLTASFTNILDTQIYTGLDKVAN